MKFHWFLKQHQLLRVLNSDEPIRDVLAQSGCRVLWLCLRLCLFTVYLAGADAVVPVRGALGMLKLRAESSLDVVVAVSSSPCRRRHVVVAMSSSPCRVVVAAVALYLIHGTLG